MLFGFQRPDLNPACNPFCEPSLQPDEQPTKIILNCQHLFLLPETFFFRPRRDIKAVSQKGLSF